jgi:hypothetical protein
MELKDFKDVVRVMTKEESKKILNSLRDSRIS